MEFNNSILNVIKQQGHTMAQASNLFMAKGHACYCQLVLVLHVEK
jgi:hypothetical protein